MTNKKIFEKKISAEKKFSVKKIVCHKKIFIQKKFHPPKKFWLKKILGKKNCPKKHNFLRLIFSIAQLVYQPCEALSGLSKSLIWLMVTVILRWYLKYHLIIFSGYYYYSTTTATETTPLTPFSQWILTKFGT